MASIEIVAPRPRARVRGTTDVVVEVRLDGGDGVGDGVDGGGGGGGPGEVEVVIGPALYGTRRALPVDEGGAGEGGAPGPRRFRYRWVTTQKLVDPDVDAPGDALFWITATARVEGALLRAGPVPVLTANHPDAADDPDDADDAATGDDDASRREALAERPREAGGWREELAWAADYSGSFERWRRGHGAVVGERAASLVDDPVLGRSRRVLRVVVPDAMAGDPDQPTPTTVRFQASSPQVVREGDELCVGFALLLPDTFPTVYPTGDPTNPGGPRGTGYVALFQLYGPPYRQGSALVLHADRRTDADPLDELSIRGNELNPGDPEALLALPYRRGTWTDVVLRMRVSTSVTDGWIEAWANQGESAAVRPMPLAGVGLRVPRVLLREDSRELRTDLQVYRVKDRIPSVGVWFAGHRVARTVEEADPRSHARGAAPAGGRP